MTIYLPERAVFDGNYFKRDKGSVPAKAGHFPITPSGNAGRGCFGFRQPKSGGVTQVHNWTLFTSIGISPVFTRTFKEKEEFMSKTKNTVKTGISGAGNIICEHNWTK